MDENDLPEAYRGVHPVLALVARLVDEGIGELGEESDVVQTAMHTLGRMGVVACGVGGELIEDRDDEMLVRAHWHAPAISGTRSLDTPGLALAAAAAMVGVAATVKVVQIEHALGGGRAGTRGTVRRVEVNSSVTGSGRWRVRRSS